MWIGCELPFTCLHALQYFLKQVKFTTSWCLRVCVCVCVCVCACALLTNFRSVCSLLRHFFFRGTTVPFGSGYSHCRGFTITLTHTTLSRTPLDKWSARCKDLYPTTHNTHTSKPPVWSEPAIPGSERPQTHALGRAATAIVGLMHGVM